jgi:3-dehydroquinate synthetase
MLIAISYAHRRGALDATGVARTNELAEYVRSMLGKGESCVVQDRPTISIEAVLEKFSHDKKHRTDGYRVVMPVADGGLELVSQARTDEVHADIAAAYRETLSELGWLTV